MLPKAKRVTTPLFKDVLTQGKKVHGVFVTIRFLPTTKDNERFSVVVPTSVYKKAADRNQLKRKVRGILEQQALPKVYGIVFLKKDARTATKDALNQDVRATLKHIRA